jgi:6-phosphogluconolactonase|eukprot:COSAG02_NODE_22_length_53020_cov_16.223125_14_plen_134_part_00
MKALAFRDCNMQPSHASEISFSDDGNYLYAANRGHDSIAVFELNADSSLSLVEIVPSGGRVPWTMSFVDVPAAGYQLMLVQNEFSGTSTEPVPPGNVSVFRRDISTGRLTTTGHTAVIDKPMFVGVLPDPRKL